MNLEVVARTGQIYSGPVSEVVVPAYEGPLAILAGHSPILGMLVPGQLRYTNAEGEHHYEVGAGFVTVESDEVTVVVETAK
ncbi:MAG: F0F1 ATP synthase subunit epsilon [Trueperella sp.]|nr:F0F1 ATP synthase subunit epsilon [Trueperella sp.]